MTVIGWDIGGVNTKVACVDDGDVRAVIERPFEIQHDPTALSGLLQTLAAEVGAPSDALHAVTMTAELSQAFRTKREGVAFVLDAVEAAFPDARVLVYAVDGRFLPPNEARDEPLAVAAANWAATARVVASTHPTALLVDIGTTTTDVIPIVDGHVVAQGWTDPERLASGELVYTGAVRTPVEAIATHVPYGSGMAHVSAESFALAGDVHVWRGELDPVDYTAMPPDRRPTTREFAGERLARAICADRELVDAAGVSRIADAFAAAQCERVADAIGSVCRRHGELRVAVVTGLGGFIAARAAGSSGLEVVRLAEALGADAARCAPAAAVALLLHAERAGVSGARTHGSVSEPSAVGRGPSCIDVVVKVGGSLLGDLSQLDAVLAEVARVAVDTRLLVVPGGGPFADAVREADRRVRLSDDAAHWMAILAMDQYAHVLAERMPGGVLVATSAAARAALLASRVPVLAPSQWLQQVDPLPHSWDVTSDSIAGWIAGEVGATRLVLVKPSGAAGPSLVDDYFERARSAGVEVTVVTADRLDVLRSPTVGGPRVAL